VTSSPGQLAAGSHTDQGRGLVEALNVSAAGLQKGFQDLADAFQTSYWVAFTALFITLVPVFFLPRKREVSHLLDDEDGDSADAVPAVMH